MEITPEKRFGLTINGRVVRTPIAVASMAGTVDAAYALERADNIGAAFIGGYSIDGPALEASRMMAAEGRDEFLFEDPVKEIGHQLDLMSGSDIVAGVNIRAGSPESYADIAKTYGRAAVYEIDAHCRQLPMVQAGCGEYLLTDPVKLIRCVKALKSRECDRFSEDEGRGQPGRCRALQEALDGRGRPDPYRSHGSRVCETPADQE